MKAEFEQYEAGRRYDVTEAEAVRLCRAGAAQIAEIETAALSRGRLREPSPSS